MAEIAAGMRKIKGNLAPAEGTKIDTAEFCKRVRKLKAVKSMEAGKLSLMRNNWVVRFAQDQDIVKKEMWTKNCNTRATPEQLAELMRCLEQNEPFPKSFMHLVTPDRLLG